HQAQRLHIREVALAAALCDGQNVIGVPEIAAMAPVPLELFARLPIQLALAAAQRFGVGPALRAHAAIAREYLLAQVAGIGALRPRMDAIGAAGGESALGNGDAAPAAESALALDPAARHGAARAHSRKS